MNSKAGENLCRFEGCPFLPVVLPPFLLQKLLLPSFLSFFSPTTMSWSLCDRIYAKNWEYSG